MTTATVETTQSAERRDINSPIATKDNLMAILESRKASIAAILPRHLSADRVLKLALLAFSRTPKLMDCTGISVLSAITRAAELGIDFTGTLGGGYLIPYGRECQFIIGYRGLMDLARRHGDVKVIEARVVRTGDRFDYDYGLETKLTHKPDPSSSGKLTHVYAIARYESGFSQFEVMTKAEVERIRQISKMPNGPLWKDHYDAAAMKTVVRKLCKMLPCSPEFIEAVRDSDEVEFGQAMNIIDMEEPKSGVDRLAESLGVAKSEDPLTKQLQDSVAAVSDDPAAKIIEKRQDIIDRYRGMSPALRDIFHGAIGFATDVEAKVLAMNDLTDLGDILAHAVNVTRKQPGNGKK